MIEIVTLLGQIIVALIITIVIEVLVAYFFNFRKKEQLLSVIGINFVTNPIANFLFQLKIIQFSIPNVLLFEVLIVIVEALILAKVLNKQKREMLILSLTINLFSFLTGVILFWR